MASNKVKANNKSSTCTQSDVCRDTTPIIVTDLASGEVKTFAFKRAFLDSPLFEEYYARRRDFLIECGCKEEDRALLYGRKQRKFDPPTMQLCTYIDKKANWPHESHCMNWPTVRPPRPDEPLTKIDRHSGASVLLGAAPLTPFSSSGKSNLPSQNSQSRCGVSGPNTSAGAILFALDAADLNTHTPQSPVRNWGDAAARLRVAIARLRDPTEPEDGFQVVSEGNRLNFAKLPLHTGAADEVTTPTRILCCVTSTRSFAGLIYLTIEGFPYEIEMQRSRWDYAVKRSTSRHTRRALNELNSSHKNAQVIALLDVTRDACDAAVAHTAGLCAVSKNFIPIESSFELQVANQLSYLGRAFTKDIYVPAGKRFRFDFRVFLEDGELIIEVHGMDQEKYLADKKAVESHLLACYRRRHLIWRAYLGLPLPRTPRLIAENFYEESDAAASETLDETDAPEAI